MVLCAAGSEVVSTPSTPNSITYPAYSAVHRYTGTKDDLSHGGLGKVYDNQGIHSAYHDCLLYSTLSLVFAHRGLPCVLLARICACRGFVHHACVLLLISISSSGNATLWLQTCVEEIGKEPSVKSLLYTKVGSRKPLTLSVEVDPVKEHTEVCPKAPAVLLLHILVGDRLHEHKAFIARHSGHSMCVMATTQAAQLT
jgi:hypothetical protein